MNVREKEYSYLLIALERAARDLRFFQDKFTRGRFEHRMGNLKEYFEKTLVFNEEIKEMFEAAMLAYLSYTIDYLKRGNGSALHILDSFYGTLKKIKEIEEQYIGE